MIGFEAFDIIKGAVNQVNAGKLKTSDKAFKEQNDKARSGFNEALKYLNMSLELAPNDENAKKAKNNCQNQMKMLI
ncbi:MAG: hypothetical protein M1445_03505 [Bacteroidetes bacterium]|nr:hypothetical protein [Bacteroidota bacterium]